MLITRKDVSDLLYRIGKSRIVDKEMYKQIANMDKRGIIKIVEEEIEKLIKNDLPIESLGIVKIKNHKLNWIIFIKGPNNTPYENGIFKIEIKFRESTQICGSFVQSIPERPYINFLNKIYHIQVEPFGGNFDVKMLRNWEPTTSFIELLGMLYLIFIFDQNADNPLNRELIEDYRNNRSEFNRKAKEYTEKYAEIYEPNIFKNEQEKEINKFISVIFTSTDQKVHYSIVCQLEDNFSIIEQRLYEEYPEYKNLENNFIAKGNVIEKNKSLKKNNISNSDVITLLIND